MPKITDITPSITIPSDAELLGVSNGLFARLPLTSIKGVDGTNGANGAGVPVGGTVGQVLTKVDSTDYNVEWADATGGGGAIVDFTNLSPTLLSAGDTAFIDYTTTSTASPLALNIITEEGLYEMTVISQQDGTIGSVAYLDLKPNNTTVTAGAIDRTLIYMPYDSTAGTTAIAPAGVQACGGETTFALAFGQVSHMDAKISTFTKSKTAFAQSLRRDSASSFYTYINTFNWLDTTTAWTSLGTLVFPFAQAGKIIVKRII